VSNLRFGVLWQQRLSEQKSIDAVVAQLKVALDENAKPIDIQKLQGTLKTHQKNLAKIERDLNAIPN